MAWNFSTGALTTAASLAVLICGCTTPIPDEGGPIAALEFSATDISSSVTAATLDGTYQLRLICTGPGEVTVQVLVDQTVAADTSMPCTDNSTTEVVITPITGDVELKIHEADDAEGIVELHGPSE